MNATLLVVEDDPQFHRLVVPLLEGRGYRILQASTGRSASELLQKQAPDLIVVDGLLPDTTGIKWIAGLPRSGRTTPILFVSSFWRDLQAAARLRALGVSLIVYKPVVPTVFAEQVEQLLLAAPALPRPKPSKSEDEKLGFAERLSAIRLDYGRSLGKRQKLLTTLLDRARDEEEAYDEARMLVHKIRGTAASCDYSAVGEAAGRVEDALLRGRDLGETGLFRVWPSVEAAFREFSLAVAQVEEDLADVPSTNFPPSSSGSMGPRLLFVHSDSFLGTPVERAARRQLLDVVAAHSANEALREAKALSPDIAVIDVDLSPAEAAFDLARSLRSLPGCENLPLAFLAQEGGVAQRVLAAHAGASVFLTKPIEASAIEGALQQLLAQGQQEQPHILLVDDDEFFCRRLVAVLRRHRFRVSVLHEASRLLDALDERHPDMLLVDGILPGISGLDICRMLRTMPRWQELPILFLTAQIGLDSRVAAFQAGADDYLGKPIVEEELLARIRVRIERMRLLRDRANKDPLTGLLTRRTLLDLLSARVGEANRHARSLALCLIDLDTFKSINDTHGHLAGDQVLAGFGQLLLRRFRREDLRARWGGEEFIVAFPGEIAGTVEAVLARVLREFREVDFVGAGGATFHVTFSAGVASFPADGVAVEDLLRVVDTRLYAAKRVGRNRIVGPSTLL